MRNRPSPSVVGAGPLRFLALSLAFVLAMFTGGGLALADIDPAGCEGSGATLDISVFRANGTTVITAGDTVSDNEIIRYQAVLSAVPGTCAYSGGAWTLTTPNGVVTNLAAMLPGGVVPRIGGSGVASVTAPQVQYTVTHANETNSLQTKV